MLTLDDMGEGGVQKSLKLDDVINEQPLRHIYFKLLNVILTLDLSRDTQGN